MSTKPLASPAIADAGALLQAAKDACRKLDPRQLARNPVMFVTAVVAALVTLLWLRDLNGGDALFSGQIAAWLWFTVLFANFAEAIAEGRGKAQADALRRTRSDVRARRYVDAANLAGVYEGVNAQDLKVGDIGSSRRAMSSRSTARSSRAWRPSTKPRSPANPRPSFARRAAIAPPSPAARR